MEGDRHGEPGEHEVGGVVEGIADRQVVAEGAVEDDLHRQQRVDVDEPEDDAGHQEGQRDVHQRDQRDVYPERNVPRRRAHSGATVTAPGRLTVLSRAAYSGPALTLIRRSEGRRVRPKCVSKYEVEVAPTQRKQKKR